ncbi:FAD/NAD(P)-binding protein [Mesobacillus subterraneus]|uniref:Uncharacterized protein n=1 Tax=Mesobacillus subterraneus TaxID=285983 RepID=A0A427TNH5_9BACI|nr:FAD/NAD(P)-binding protein [Mesobacillus subterraneus]RSD25905.1 hypothetical protein EJA10_16095 [Mesobacillus subterraneus]
MMYDWVVIGGGIHGCTVSAFLLKNKKVLPEGLRIIDPHDSPLFTWMKNTERIGMQFLRSPFVHHLDVDPFSLIKFAGKQHKKRTDFYGVYKRPSLPIFNEHSLELFRDLRLMECWHQGSVNWINRDAGSWSVSTVSGEVVRSKNIVLALSVNEQLNIPDWADSIGDDGKQTFHIFDRNVDLSRLQAPVAVIGGGITAAHLVIKLSALYPGQVHLFKRHPFRVYDFDSDPGWLGPKKQTTYAMIKDYTERREMIKQARNRGSLPKELFYRLKVLEKNQLIKVTDGEIINARRSEGPKIVLSTDQQEVKVRSVVFATGFKPSRPGGEWLETAIQRHALPCAECGYPIVSESLEWCKNLYVMGPLAELEIGPIARNISGARQAAERIVRSVL